MAIYERRMLYPFLKGKFPKASLHPHPAHKKIALLLSDTRHGDIPSEDDSWALMSLMPGKKGSSPSEVAAHGLLSGMSRVSDDEARGVHQPLPVLPEVFLYMPIVMDYS